MANLNRGGKNGWTLFLLILAGIVLGGLLGELTAGSKYFSWLNLAYAYGMENPLSIDLKVISFMFKINLVVSVSSVIGIALAIFTYKKI